MILKAKDSKYFLTNLLADFIINKIGLDYDSIIKVVDFENFMVIKGKTSSKEVLNMPEVIQEFNESMSQYLGDYKVSRTIDIIEYDAKLEKHQSIKVSLHNSDNCSYHRSQIKYPDNVSTDYTDTLQVLTDDVVVSSNFPHGYSLSQGRSLYYLCKKIFYSIPSTYPVSSLNIQLDLSKDDSEKLKIYNLFYHELDEILISAAMDCVNLDLSQIEKEIKKVDLLDELINPLSEYEFLKNIGDMIII